MGKRTHLEAEVNGTRVSVDVTQISGQTTHPETASKLAERVAMVAHKVYEEKGVKTFTGQEGYGNGRTGDILQYGYKAHIGGRGGVRGVLDRLTSPVKTIQR